MKKESHTPLTDESSAARVDPVVPELSTLSPADRAIVGSAETRRARARVAPFITLAIPQLQAINPVLPSYVQTALTALVDAFGQWERDETAVLNGE